MRRLTDSERDDSGIATIFLILAMTAIFVGAGFAIDVGGYVATARSAQNSADATVVAVATDCALTGAPIADYSPYRKDGQTISTPACGSGQATITVTKDVGGLLLERTAGAVDRSATARWGTIASANTLPITIASCEFTPSILDGTANIYLYLDQPSPGSGCSGGPGGFGSLTDTGSDTDCLTVSVVNNVAVGGTGASDHAAQCFTARYGAVLNGGGYVDVLVPIYGPYSHVGSTYNYTIVGYAAFRLRGYEFNGAPGDAGTLDGGANCPNIGPGNEYCLHGDFVRFVTSQGTPGPSMNFGTVNVYLFS